MTAILILSAIGILYILSDTITDFLSDGKSFLPKDLKQLDNGKVRNNKRADTKFRSW